MSFISRELIANLGGKEPISYCPTRPEWNVTVPIVCSWQVGTMSRCSRILVILG